MKTKTEEVQEITVLTDEQIALLPDETKESVIFLTEHVNPTDLAKLNPMAEELLEIREIGSKLKLMPAVDGKFDKKNIQEFTNIKTKIRSFRAGVKSTAKELKEEPAKITKAIIAIEKEFINEATIVYDAAETEFNDFIVEEERIKAEKQAKKDAELLASVNAAKAEANEANEKMQKTNIYNKIKYEIIGGLSETVSEALLDANKNKLLSIKESYTKSEYIDAIHGLDISILDENVRTELAEKFASTKSQSLRLIQEKLDAIKNEEDNAILKATSANNTPAPLVQEEVKEEPQVPVVPEEPRLLIPTLNELDDNEFIDYVLNELKILSNLTIKRVEDKPSSSPKIYDLRNSLSIFK